MKAFFIVLTLTFFSVKGRTQRAEDSVKAVINTLFTAMKSADADLLKTVFSDDVIFQTIGKSKEGRTVIKSEDPVGFLKQVGAAEPGSLDEQITFETIKVDGPLATVWTPYKFFYKGKFSHCGVNSFQLVRLDGIWKIQYLIDTRRPSDCK